MVCSWYSTCDALLLIPNAVHVVLYHTWNGGSFASKLTLNVVMPRAVAKKITFKTAE